MLTKTHFKAQCGLVARSVRFEARLMSTKSHFEALFVADENQLWAGGSVSQKAHFKVQARFEERFIGRGK